MSSFENRFSFGEFEGGSSLASGSETALAMLVGNDHPSSGGDPGIQMANQLQISQQVEN